MALTQIDDRGLKTPIDLLDNEKIRLGTGNDLELYHDGSNSYIKDTGTGNLQIVSNQTNIQDADLSHYQAKFIDGGAVELYHSGTKKFETTTDGVQVTGEVVSGTLHCSGKLDLPDSSGATVGRVLFGDSDDLQIWHDGNHSYILENGTGDLKIETNGTAIQLGKSDGEVSAKFIPDGAVELYYDNSKKFETVTGGVYVYGDIVGGVGGTGNISLGDSSKFIAGSGNDLQIYHDGTNSHLTNSTGYVLVNSTGGDLALRSSADVYLQPASGETSVVGKANGATEIYYDNTKRFETQSGGAQVFGTLQVDGQFHPYSDNNNDLGLSGNRWQDLYLSGQIYLGGTGASNSLEDYEEGTFTPSFGGDSGNGSYTYNKQAGKYTKIGNVVFFQLYITVNAVNSHSSGNTMVNGLPFTPTSGNDYSAACVGYYHNFNGIVPSQALVDVGQTRLYLYKNNNSSNISHSSPTDVQNNTSLIISGHYYTA